VSNRLLEELKAVGLAASAEVSERLAPRLGMQVKASTLLRYLRTIPPPSDAPVRVLGIDDFAMRRGDSYGTIFVNIKTGKPLDLLPDRTAEAVLPWLKRHQEIEVVSRDRASAYADVQMEGETCRFRKKYLPLFASYWQKKRICRPRFGRNTCRNS
jgi:transposase